MLRKLLAIVSLSGLLLASVPALAESLSAPNLPSCCNSIYCPMRHHQSGNQDMPQCNMPGHSLQNDCSTHACDMAQNPAVGTPLFVLMAPVALAQSEGAEPAPIQGSPFFAYHLNLPLTPPPRTLLG